MNKLKLLFAIIICTLASLPLATLMHEGTHWILDEISPDVEPTAICWNPHPLTNGPAIMFVTKDITISTEEDYKTFIDNYTSNDLKEEILAYAVYYSASLGFILLFLFKIID